MTKFRSPQRRKVRQRSGFTTAEDTTGGECEIKLSKKLEVQNNNLEIHFRKTDVNIPELFQNYYGIVAFGGYIYSLTDVNLSIEISCYIKEADTTLVKEREKKIEAHNWYNIGNHIEVEIDPLIETEANLDTLLRFTGKEKIGEIHFFGINLDSVKWENYIDNIEYKDGKTIEERFHQKTSLCIPYLYYFDHEEPFYVLPDNVCEEEFKQGIPVLLKSCNRCARFLPTEYIKEKQRNLISFGNHCVTRAPCEHSTFSQLKVIYDECLENNVEKPDELNAVIHIQDNIKTIGIYYGYQLECKACKKFYVNAPLNPMRTPTQHREDSLRRRAIDVLANKLLDKESIYEKFKRQGKNFDKFIWEKFNKRCFKCGQKVAYREEIQIDSALVKMHIDHTMPLSALWPLDETATLLCSTCNSEKSNKFPVEFYTTEELNELAEITGIEREILLSKKINEDALSKLLDRIEWFFDIFLNDEEYQKVRGYKKASDLIVRAIQKQICRVGLNFNLIEIYKDRTGKYPDSITLEPRLI